MKIIFYVLVIKVFCTWIIAWQCKEIKLAEQNSKLERCIKVETELYGSVIIIVDFYL